MSKSDFLPLRELAELTGLRPRTLYNQHHRGDGALSPILTKFGGRLGAWRSDWECWLASQRRLPAKGGDLDATNAQATSINTKQQSRESNDANPAK
jgi:predicted DNA-binding transcriptional regulator AlpA